MNNIKLSFNFKEKDSNLNWFICWIEKIMVEGDRWKVRIFLRSTVAMKINREDWIQGKTKVLLLNSNYLSVLELGMIFNSNGEYILNSSELTNISVFSKENYSLCSKNLIDLVDGSHFFNNIDIRNFSYYYYVSGSSKGKRTKVILPAYTILRCFFFKSSILVDRLLRFGVQELFVGRYINTSSEGEQIGILTYNNKLIEYKEAFEIAKWMFTKDDVGFKVLNLISSGLRNQFSKNREDNSANIQVKNPFQTECNIDLKGFNIGNGFNSFFIATRITDIKLKKNCFTVDRFELDPKYPNDSTDQRLNHSVEEVKRPIIQVNNLNELELKDSRGNRSVPRTDMSFELDTFKGLELPGSKVKRSEQDGAYKVMPIESNIELTESTLDQGTGTFKSPAAPISIKSIKKVDRSELLRRSLFFLSEEYNVKSNFRSIPITNTIYTTSPEIHEINYDKKIFYLIKLMSGNLGIIRNRSYSTINQFDLTLFIEHIYKELSHLPKNKRIWTEVRRNPKHDQGKIVIETSVNHQVKNFESLDDAAFHMAEKIFNDRILRSLAS